MPFRILIAGKRNSGKTTLACSLHAAFLAEGYSCEHFELDPYSETKDYILGLKPWSMRRKTLAPPREKFQVLNRMMLASTADYVIGDLPGRIHDKNRLLIQGADGVIFVDRSPLQSDRPHDPTRAEWDAEHHDPTYAEWCRYFESAGVRILLRVFSLREGERAPADGSIPIYGLRRVLLHTADIAQLVANLRRVTSGRAPA